MVRDEALTPNWVATILNFSDLHLLPEEVLAAAVSQLPAADVHGENNSIQCFSYNL